jgi:anaerobic selenocysteine-containing dehydrogenase
VSDVEVKKSICIWCKGECGVLVHVKDGRLVKLEEDPDWPKPLKAWPPTKTCVRFKAAVEWFYHPERLHFPLRRAGEKGEGKWQRISWNQALDEIGEKLRQIRENYGPQSVSSAMGTGPRTEISVMRRFFAMIGSVSDCMQGTICFVPRAKIADALAGWYPHFSVRQNTKCIVALGAEALVARPVTARAILDARKEGGKLIVIDPRKTRSASMADVWLQIRPGTDTALLLAMATVIVKEELYDKEFVEKWCHGFEELKRHIEEYSPEKAEGVTHIPAEQIREAARLYAANRPGCFIEGMGVEHLQNSAQALHARWILAGLTGNINIEGGDEQWGPHSQIRHSMLDVVPSLDIDVELFEKQLGTDRFKFFSMENIFSQIPHGIRVWGKPSLMVTMGHGPTVYRTMISGEPYPIKAMICAAGNPMVTQANTKLVYNALKSLDLFVVNDFWLTPTAELADYVLPIACWLERPFLHDFYGYSSYVIAGEAALPKEIPGEYEHRLDYDIWHELAKRLGMGKYFPWKDLQGYYDHLLEPTGYTHQEFVEKVRFEKKPARHRLFEEKGFATRTGKVELYSTTLENLGYNPLPQYKEPAETEESNPELAKEYPLRLITGGRTREFYHSEWRQIDSVRKLHPDPLLQIHPETAARLGIADGEWIWIETLRGRVRQKAQLFDGIPPNVVHAEHGWWLPELPGEEPWLHGVWEVNINVVLNDDPDVCNEITGSWPLKTALCKVYKVKKY